VSPTRPTAPPGASGPVNGTTSYTYSNLGKVTKITDRLGNATSYSYDQLGDLADQTDPGGRHLDLHLRHRREQISVTDPTGAQPRPPTGLGRALA
jgi:YD repeat-containing protein